MGYLNNDNQRFVNFSHQTKSYLDGNISANKFHLHFVSLFRDDAAGKALFAEFVALLPDPAKRRQLLEQAQKAEQIKSEFPSLGGSNNSASVNTVTTGAYRGAVSGARSSVNSSGFPSLSSANNSSFPSLSSAEAFPSLPAAPPQTTGRGGKKKRGGGPVRSSDLFPALPAAGRGYLNNPFFSDNPQTGASGASWANAAGRGRGRGRGRI
eukprot:TRINITY_DN2815_c0_g1_i2.p1 TRINITY_DN2815_c0_g1~~TRINITY_DN2815_c0_g1_i2.p1  ORF type:complete len:210 (-),score=46.51 TRINITY_DN2815_c0_g1_i2:48-677(-)